VGRNKALENLAFELHDSHLLGVRKVEGKVHMDLSLYLQASAVEPGRDPGTGWAQEAEAVIEQGTIEIAPPPGDLWILDGSVQVAEATFDNLVPLPFKRSGRTRIHLHGAGWNLIATGTGFEVVLKGQRVFIEDLP
jgi:hypothetical protein